MKHKLFVLGKKRPGRPPRRKSSPIKKLVGKKAALIKQSLRDSQVRRRGRPPGAKNRTSAIKEQLIEMQRKLEKEFEEKKRKKDEEERKAQSELECKTEKEEEQNDFDSSAVEEKVEISSTSVPVSSNKVSSSQK